jgi:probable HAF family extracellular repeat protein
MLWCAKGRLWWPVAVGLGAVLNSAAVSAAADAPVLHNLGESLRSVTAISADGSTVAGFYPFAPGVPHGFKWTVAGGLQDLGTLPGTTGSWGYGVNADGSVVCGQSPTPAPPSNLRAVRKVGSSPMVNLGTLPGGFSSSAIACNADGSVVVGTSTWGGYATSHAFRWSSTGGFTDLFTLAGGSDSTAVAVDQTGSVVAGWSYAAGGVHAFRWAAQTGMIDLTPGTNWGQATSVSADGSVVVGYTMVGPTYHAFRWTASGGTTDLGVFENADTQAKGVSADGSLLVGGGNFTAWFWTSARGFVNLRQELIARGVDLSEMGAATWDLREAVGVSADGTSIIGWGFRNGAGFGWLVTGFAAAQCGPGDIGKAGGVAGADGQLDNNDLVVFIDWFFAGDTRADIGATGGVAGADGVFDNNDFVVFVDRLFAHCV